MNAPATAIQTVEQDDSPRQLALLRAIGFDKLSVEQRELALNIAGRYDLDPLLKHLVMIEGRAYITRDGLLHVAHRSGQLDGIETTEPVLIEKFWTAKASVYRKDMSRAFTYAGRYPVDGYNKKYAPEMAVKVAEVMALRRAFDVAAPTAEERWDVDVPAEPPKPAPSLAEVVAEKAAEVAPTPAEKIGLNQGVTHDPVSDPPEGMTYADFRTAFARSGEKPTKAVVTSTAVELFPELEEVLRMKDAKDWPLNPGGWAQLADALGLA